ASWMLIIGLVFVALSYGQSIFLPFIIALLIWFVVKKARNMIDKIGFVHKYIPKWLKTLFASCLVFGILLLTGHMLTVNIENIASRYYSYAANSEEISSKINEFFDVGGEEQIKDFVESGQVGGYLQNAFRSISEILGNMLMIAFYTIFLFIEEGLVNRKMRLFFGDKERFEAFMATAKKIDNMLSRYIILKSMINLFTSTVAFIIMWSVGLQSPFFWAAIIFFLSFIPSIGPIVAILLPSAFAVLQFGDFIPCWIILFSVGTIQIIVGNYLEPRIMGNTLNISPLVAIFSLALWGSLWGIVGMLLSVPITVAIIIVMSQFPSTRKVAILLSEKGKV
ncbi:MAG: AI-2 transport protein TqsA, partial [Crocinitomicaceae bacterium]